MLLALDAGNSNITIGALDGRTLLFQWRLRTVHEQTADEWGILLRNLFSPAGLDIAKVDGMIISSVVPPIDSINRLQITSPSPVPGGRLALDERACANGAKRRAWSSCAMPMPVSATSITTCSIPFSRRRSLTDNETKP